MSLIADIRAQMARESGPVHPKHIAEVLDQDLATVRNTMNQANTKGYGIERLEDGTFSLIPNWVPARGPNAAAESAPAATPTPAKPKPKKAAMVKAKAPAKKVKKDKKAKTEKPKRVYTRKAAATPRTPKKLRAVVALQAADEYVVHLTRSSLKALVSAVLDGEQQITPELRAALREANRLTASA